MIQVDETQDQIEYYEETNQENLQIAERHQEQYQEQQQEYQVKIKYQTLTG